MSVSENSAEKAGTMHQLKTWPEYFDAIWNDRKTFEVRRDDRGFQTGDLVWLREYGKRHGEHVDSYSGRSIIATIGYVLRTVPGGGDLGRFVVFSLLGLAKYNDADAIGTYSPPPVGVVMSGLDAERLTCGATLSDGGVCTLPRHDESAHPHGHPANDCGCTHCPRCGWHHGDTAHYCLDGRWVQ